MASRKRKRPRAKRPTRIPHPRVGPAFEELVQVMARLRAPGGCPWDREQTHATLRTYLIEEAYEVLDALDGADDVKFAEELGDLLLQVLFHSEIARQEGRFSIQDVIREIHEKMIRRHPHVFGEKRAKDAAEVLRNWEIIKQQERLSKSTASHTAAPLGRHPAPVARDESASPAASSSARNAVVAPASSRQAPSSPGNHVPESLLDGVPHTLPALLEAYQLTRKAARIGFDWDHIGGIFDKLLEETNELRHALAQPVAPASSRPSDSVQLGVPGAPRSAAPSGRHPAPVVQGESASPAASSSIRQAQAIESELGDLFFTAVNLARFLHIDPEIAMKKASAKFSRRFRAMEQLARRQGATLANIPRAQLESLWDQAKRFEL